MNVNCYVILGLVPRVLKQFLTRSVAIVAAPYFSLLSRAGPDRPSAASTASETEHVAILLSLTTATRTTYLAHHALFLWRRRVSVASRTSRTSAAGLRSRDVVQYVARSSSVGLISARNPVIAQASVRTWVSADLTVLSLASRSGNLATMSIQTSATPRPPATKIGHAKPRPL